MISFWVIGMFWMGHHRIFGLATKQGPRIVGWNLFLLGSIAFLPFSTAFLSAYAGDRVPTIFYCVSLLHLRPAQHAGRPDRDQPADGRSERAGRGYRLFAPSRS